MSDLELNYKMIVLFFRLSNWRWSWLRNVFNIDAVDLLGVLFAFKFLVNLRFKQTDNIRNWDGYDEAKQKTFKWRYAAHTRTENNIVQKYVKIRLQISQNKNRTVNCHTEKIMPNKTMSLKLELQWNSQFQYIFE
jgi:hypothetical protein